MFQVYLLVIWITSTISQTFLDSNVFIYHLSPILRIPLNGIDAHTLLPHLKLDISTPGQPILKVDRDYTITAGDGELILNLIKNKR